MKKFCLFLVLLTMVMSIQSCKKIQVPNAEARKIFGEWNFITSSGGLFGKGDSQRYIHGDWVEFSEKGKLKIHYVDGAKKTIKFTIEMQKSIIDHQLRPTLLYGNNLIEEGYEISKDTLIMNQEAYDGFQYVFIRR